MADSTSSGRDRERIPIEEHATLSQVSQGERFAIEGPSRDGYSGIASLGIS